MARTLREEQTRLAGISAADPWWGQRFWRFAAMHEAQGAISPMMKMLLTGFGYIVAATLTLPRVTEMTAVFLRLEAPPGVSALAPPPGAGVLGPGTDAGVARWSHSLPPDLKRAAPEMYRNMRSEGCVTIRDWLAASHGNDR